MEEEKIARTTQNENEKRNAKKYLFHIVLSILVIGIVVGGFLYKTQWEEYKAKRVVNRYLSSMKNAKLDTLEYLDITALGNKWKYSLNVIGYKYLSTLSREKDVVHSDTITYDKDFYESSEYFKSSYKTLKDFLDYEQNILDIVNKSHIEQGKEPHYKYTRTEDSLVTEYPDTKNVFMFFYDVSLTNRLGMVLHKRFLFVVDNDSDKYKIVDFDYDGLADELESVEKSN